MNEFPTDKNEKAVLVKKFISIYKKIREEKGRFSDNQSKMDNYVNNLAFKLNEPIHNIKVYNYGYIDIIGI